MPVEFDEGDLIFSFDNPLAVVRFDDDTTHGIKHFPMKRVDFIVTFTRQTWLIEVKDPEDRAIPAHLAASRRKAFREKMHSGTLYRRELLPKLRDTLIYLTLSHCAPTNEMRYVVFIGMTRLDAAMLLTAQNRLRKVCYLPGPFQRDWASRFEVVVLNMAEWNRKLAPHSVRRP